jgi:protein-export membrane protein, SecD/SecF family
MFKIIEKTKIWFIGSLLIIAIGIGFCAVKGVTFGIDFVGGSSVQVDLKQNFNTEDIRQIAAKYTNDATVQTVEKTGFMLRSSSITADQVEKFKAEINSKYNVDPASWQNETVGPSIGKELTQKAILAFIVSIIGMLIYIAVRFEIRFGVAAIIALVHDLLITLTVYAVFQIPINNTFIAAILTILGYSINDTIVIFDRIRENMRLMGKVSYEELADVSMTESMSRSINTGMTTLFTITAIYFIGVSAVKELALPLIIGIISGTYSSIFIATPIWVLWKNADKKKKSLAKA